MARSKSNSQLLNENNSEEKDQSDINEIQPEEQAENELQQSAETTLENSSDIPSQEIQPNLALEIPAPKSNDSPAFNFVLVVINPFMSYRKGQVIVNPYAIEAVIAQGNLPNCLKVKR